MKRAKKKVRIVLTDFADFKKSCKFVKKRKVADYYIAVNRHLNSYADFNVYMRKNISTFRHIR